MKGRQEMKADETRERDKEGKLKEKEIRRFFFLEGFFKLYNTHFKANIIVYTYDNYDNK